MYNVMCLAGVYLEKFVRGGGKSQICVCVVVGGGGGGGGILARGAFAHCSPHS